MFPQKECHKNTSTNATNPIPPTFSLCCDIFLVASFPITMIDINEWPPLVPPGVPPCLLSIKSEALIIVNISSICCHFHYQTDRGFDLGDPLEEYFGLIEPTPKCFIAL